MVIDFSLGQRVHPGRYCCIGGVNFGAWCRVAIAGALLRPRMLGRFLG